MKKANSDDASIMVEIKGNIQLTHLQGPVAVPVEKCTQVLLYPCTSTSTYEASAQYTYVQYTSLIPGAPKALPVGACEKTKSGDKAGERNLFKIVLSNQ